MLIRPLASSRDAWLVLRYLRRYNEAPLFTPRFFELYKAVHSRYRTCIARTGDSQIRNAQHLAAVLVHVLRQHLPIWNAAANVYNYYVINSNITKWVIAVSYWHIKKQFTLTTVLWYRFLTLLLNYTCNSSMCFHMLIIPDNWWFIF